MRFLILFSVILGLSSTASASNFAPGFNPKLNIDELAKISWKNGEAKLAIRNDWIARYLTLALNEEIRNSSDIKSGSGEVYVVDQSVGDSVINLGFDFNVVPDRVWFDPHVLCNGKIRISFPQTNVANARAVVLDREPIEHCEVNGSVGQGLDLGRLVKNRLNEKIAKMGDRNFLIDIGKALFGNEDLRDRMTRMYLLQEILPVTTMGMDDCATDPTLGIPPGSSICLKLQWPAGTYDDAVTKILNALPVAQPVDEDIADDRIQQWKKSAPVCLHHGTAFPSKDGCDTGDMNLFSGLLCLSGEQKGCQMVRESQDPTGRWWRSPQRLGRAGENFSPDMFLGAVAYLSQTRDQGGLQNWLKSILGQSRLYPTVSTPRLQVFQSCPDGAQGVCNVMGTEWYWLQRMKALTSASATTPDYGYDSSWLVVEALANERGFRLHLVAVNVLLQQMFGDATDANVILAAKILAAREPKNPFFNYLAVGRDRRVLDLINDQCPASGVQQAHQDEWSWERKIEDRAFERSMGWDCVFWRIFGTESPSERGVKLVLIAFAQYNG